MQEDVAVADTQKDCTHLNMYNRAFAQGLPETVQY